MKYGQACDSYAQTSWPLGTEGCNLAHSLKNQSRAGASETKHNARLPVVLVMHQSMVVPLLWVSMVDRQPEKYLGRVGRGRQSCFKGGEPRCRGSPRHLEHESSPHVTADPLENDSAVRHRLILPKLVGLISPSRQDSSCMPLFFSIPPLRLCCRLAFPLSQPCQLHRPK